MIPLTARLPRTARLALLLVPMLAACAGDNTVAEQGVAPSTSAADVRAERTHTVTAIDSMMPDVTEAVGTAAPLLSATLATKLMATVERVLVHEGEAVAAGQVLLTLDVRDIEARATQAGGALDAARAMLGDAERSAERMRALFADSAAPRAQLDAAEAALDRAQASVSAATGGVAEARANGTYGVIRAPFAGVVTERHVDPGAFAAPGSPLLTVEQSSTLRVSALVPPAATGALRRGQSISLLIEGVAATGTVEGVVAASSGGLFRLNVTVPNRDGRYPSGGAATLLLPGAEQSVRLIPRAAIVYEGDLTGIQVQTGAASVRRWVRLGRARGELVEVLSGVEPGELVLVPDRAGGGQ